VVLSPASNPDLGSPPPVGEAPKSIRVRVLARPLILAAIALVLGVACAPDRAGAALVAAIASAALLVWTGHRRRLAAVLLLPIAFFAAGRALGAIHARAAESITAITGQTRARIVLEGIVRDAPEVEGDRAKLVLDATAAASEIGGELRPAGGGVALWIERRSERPSSERAGEEASAPPDGSGRARFCGEAGDRIRVLASIRAPEGAQFPGDVSARASASRRGIALFAFARARDPCVLVRAREAGGARIAMERLRSRLHAVIDRHLPRERAAIVRAFATGDRALIDESVAADFAASGLSHLLAVSGLNLAIVSGLFVVLLLAIFRSIPSVAITVGARRVAAIAAVPFVVLYTLLVGASPSSVRAAVMVLALLLSHAILRAREAWSALAIAVIAMVAWDPSVLEDVSFQLSFAAVASLLLLYPALRERFRRRREGLPRLLRWPIDVALASGAATLGTLPLVAWHFQRVSIIGVLANVPAAPLSSLVLVPLSLAGGLLALASERAAHPILAVAGWTGARLVELAHAAGSIPFASIRIPAPNAVECALVSAGMLALVLGRDRRRLRGFGLLCFAALALEVAAVEILRRISGELVAAILPVGQGDGIVLELPRGRVVVIDTGPPAASESGRSAGERVILPYLRLRRIRAIDRLILTHPHADHVGGLRAIAAEVPIREIWWTGDRRDAPPGLLAPLGSIPPRILTATAAPEIVDGVAIEVLGPIGRAADQPIVNDGSIVVRITYGDRALLFTGDAERAAEAGLIARYGAGLRSDVLKAGHHGSNTSTSEAFLEAVRPAHAIISDGRQNRFGFPHPAVVERLSGRGVRIWRTDEQGAIFVATDGRALSVSSFLER
jgi:competence protein ComEC